MKRAFPSLILPLAGVVAAGLLPPLPALSAERDRAFFRSVEGDWSGPGEIVAGKYKGTKFTCSFQGSTPASKVGMSLDGGCRVGVFTQKMTARIEHSQSDGYKGSFMDGAAGSGLDIVSGNVVDDRKVVFNVNRKQLKGVMQARLPDEETMLVTVSVKVDSKLIPVIGMNLKRIDPAATGAIAPN